MTSSTSHVVGNQGEVAAVLGGWRPRWMLVVNKSDNYRKPPEALLGHAVCTGGGSLNLRNVQTRSTIAGSVEIRLAELQSDEVYMYAVIKPVANSIALLSAKN